MCTDNVMSQSNCLSPADVYGVKTLDSFLNRVANVWRGQIVGRKNRVEYLQLPCTLSIETTSFIHHDHKCGCMYAWTLCANGALIGGRTWEALRYVLYELHRFFVTNAARKIVVYVHDLAFFFQFARRWFRWSDVFALRAFTPASAEVDTWGMVFKCSKLLSGLNFEEISEKTGVGIEEQKPDDLMRTPDTLLTDHEKSSMIKKTFALCTYIAQCIDDTKGVENLPVTKIGYVRRSCRDSVLLHKNVEDKKSQKRQMFMYRAAMKALQLTPDEYELMKATFRGGDIRANADYIGEKVDDVVSYDISSSYAACIVCDYFPMSRGRQEFVTTEEEFNTLASKYCVIADVMFIDLQPVFGYEYYLPKSRCCDLEKIVTLNGRIVAAARCRTQLTEIDYNLMRKLYTWKEVVILKCWSYERGRLPSEFVRHIAEMYAKKTALKGVKGKEREYARLKENICSLYGMMVMSLDRDIFEYDQEEGCWAEPKKADIAEAVETENGKFARFTFYAWGVWTAASARRRLWNALINMKEDYVYCHTDCVKIRHAQSHGAYFLAYNQAIEKQLRAAAFYHDIPIKWLFPENQKGEVKPLGFWEIDEKYFSFKTNGPGRYFVCNAESGQYELCVSGINPKLAGDYMRRVFKRGAMTAFRTGLKIPAEFTGRTIHFYIDSGYTAYVKDYRGKIGKIVERSCIHVAPVEYKMTDGAEFFDYLQLLGEIDYE